METKFNKLSPALMVTDVIKTVRFYTEMLGFKLSMLVPEGEQAIVSQIDNKKK